MPQDPYASVAHVYDLSYGDFLDDVDFYINLAEIGGGSVLELGVGSGRAAIPIAQAGFDVVGIDESQSMLDAARKLLERVKLPRKGKLELIEGDMRNFELEKRFGLVFVAADTFQHLQTTKEQSECIAASARHLAPGGLFAMSIRSPASVSWEEVGVAAPVVLDWTRTDPETGDQVMKFISAEADPARMIRRMTYFYDRIHEGVVHRSVFITELRYSTQSEIELLLQHNRLRVTHVYGDYDLSPVGQGDDLIFVARAEAAR